MYAFVTLRVPAETPIIMLSDTSKRGYTMIRRCTGALTARLNGMLTTELFSFGELAKMFGTLLLDQFFICFISVLSTAMVASTGEAAMAAASMVGTINALVTLVFLSVATGGAIVIARAKGSGDLHEMRCAIGETVGLSFALGLGVAALLFTLSPLLVDWLYPNVEPLLRSYSIEYMRLMCISFIPFSVFNAIFNAYRAIGDTRSSLALTVIINGLHLVFCLLFINVLKMGITGAGLSYIVVRVVGMAAALYWLLFFHNPCGVRVGHFFRFSRRVSREIVHLGVPIAMESALMQGGMLLVQIYLARLSTMEIAAHAVSNSILNLYYIPGQTLVTLASTVCGQCIGASQPELARQYCRRLISIGRVLLVLTVVVLYPLSPLLLKLYSATEASAPIIYRSFTIAAVCMPFFWCDSYVIPMTLRSAGDAAFTSTVSVTTLLLCRCALGYMLTIVCGLGVPGVWISLAVEWLLRALVLRHRLNGTRWFKTVSAV